MYKIRNKYSSSRKFIVVQCILRTLFLLYSGLKVDLALQRHPNTKRYGVMNQKTEKDKGDNEIFSFVIIPIKTLNLELLSTHRLRILLVSLPAVTLDKLKDTKSPN